MKVYLKDNGAWKLYEGTREELHPEFRRRNIRICKDVTIDNYVRIGNCVSFRQGATVKEGAVVDKWADIRKGAVIGELVCIGTGAKIGECANVGRGAKIGNGVSVANGAIIGNYSYIVIHSSKDGKGEVVG
jgi:UDP-3-O-[3-hydroxymyristoyl] glucosamine N-acyltransferase